MTFTCNFLIKQVAGNTRKAALFKICNKFRIKSCVSGGVKGLYINYVWVRGIINEVLKKCIIPHVASMSVTLATSFYVQK